MKGYISNGICYIFPQEVAQIPEVEADFYYVQQEDYAAWVTANESLADKIVKYNFNILAAKAKPFAGHTDDNLEPEPTAYSLTLAGTYGVKGSLSVTAGDEVLDVSQTPWDILEGTVVTFAPSTGTVSDYVWDNQLSVDEHGNYYITMPSDDVTITVDYVSYDFSIDGNEISDKLAVTFDGESIQGDNYNWTNIYKGTVIVINNTVGTVDDYGWDPLLQDGEDGHWMSMPAEDTSIVINYVGGGPSGGSSGESDTPAQTTYTFEIDDTGTLINVGSYEEGDSVQYTFNHALQQEEPGMWHYEYTMSPASLSNYYFSPGTPSYLDESDPEHPVEVPEVPAEISFIMPASDVLFTITQVNEEVL